MWFLIEFLIFDIEGHLYYNKRNVTRILVLREPMRACDSSLEPSLQIKNIDGKFFRFARENVFHSLHKVPQNDGFDIWTYKIS